MKKSTIVIALGIFIVVTVFLGMNTKKMYQKQKHFETYSEVLQQLDNKPLKVIDEKGNFSETNDLKECFSERKRLTYSSFHIDKIEIQQVEEISEKQKKSLLQEYEELRKNFSKRRVITKEEPVILNATAYDLYVEDRPEYSKPRDIKLELVLIDEGEGLVIDYIKQLNKAGNKDD